MSAHLPKDPLWLRSKAGLGSPIQEARLLLTAHGLKVPPKPWGVRTAEPELLWNPSSCGREIGAKEAACLHFLDLEGWWPEIYNVSSLEGRHSDQGRT